eukprot:1154238-Pelagomonas_calceolata.AAC.6
MECFLCRSLSASGNATCSHTNTSPLALWKCGDARHTAGRHGTQNADYGGAGCAAHCRRTL